jgi:hypothetical protein
LGRLHRASTRLGVARIAGRRVTLAPSLGAAMQKISSVYAEESLSYRIPTAPAAPFL